MLSSLSMAYPTTSTGRRKTHCGKIWVLGSHLSISQWVVSLDSASPIARMSHIPPVTLQQIRGNHLTVFVVTHQSELIDYLWSISSSWFGSSSWCALQSCWHLRTDINPLRIVGFSSAVAAFCKSTLLDIYMFLSTLKQVGWANISHCGLLLFVDVNFWLTNSFCIWHTSQ